jgi:hypothetical protein
VDRSKITVNGEMLKDRTDVASGFSNYLKITTEKLNIKRIDKIDAI